MDDESLVEGLRSHDRATVTYIFETYFPKIEQFAARNGRGSKQEAEDLFMHALEVIYVRVSNRNFTLTSAFSTFLFAICRRQWLKTLKRKNREIRVTFPIHNELTEESDTLAVIERVEQYQLYRETFRHMSKGCREVLELVFEGLSMKEVAEKLGFASEQYARKRKFKCKEKLKQLIRQDPRYHEMIDHD